MSEASIINSQEIKSKIYIIRGVRVMLDSYLAELYQVTTGNLNKAVKRNQTRFPEDFMFRITDDELNLIFQNGRSSWGGSRKGTYAFTEAGVSMLSAVLNSRIAIEISIKIIRIFVELRNQVLTKQDNSLLIQTVRFIESKMETMEANHLVDHTIISGKVTKISKDNQDIREDIKRFSSILDEFQNAHIIIKRPDEDKFEG